MDVVDPSRPGRSAAQILAVLGCLVVLGLLGLRYVGGLELLPVDLADPYARTVLDRALWLGLATTVLGLLAVRASRAQDLLVVALLLGIALLLRWPGMELGIWRDEGGSFFNALGDPARLWRSLPATELNPPGYFLLLQAVLGDDTGGALRLKLPSLAFGLGLVLGTYLLGATAFSRITGVLAAGLVTVSFEAIYYAQEARPYAMTAALATFTTFFFVRALLGPRSLWPLIGLTLSAAALLYTHYTGLALYGTLIAGTLVLGALGATRNPIWPALAALAVAGMLFLPWLPTFLAHLEVGTPWIQKAPLFERPILIVKLMAYTLPFFAGGRISDVLAVGLVLIATVAVVRLLVPQAKSERDVPFAIVAGTVLAGAIGLAVLSYQDRYMFGFVGVSAVFQAILLERGTKALLARTRLAPSGLLLVAIYAAVATAAPFALTLDRLPKSGIESYLAAEPDDGETVYVMSPDYTASTFAYYTYDAPRPYLGFARNDDAHLFQTQGFAEAWAAPDAITKTEARIAALAAEGKARLVLIQDRCGAPLQDRAALAYSRANEFRAALDAAYPVLESMVYPGLKECVRVTQYALSAR